MKTKKSTNLIVSYVSVSIMLLAMGVLDIFKTVVSISDKNALSALIYVISLLAYIAIASMLFLMYINIIRGQVLTEKNKKLLQRFGVIIESLALIAMLLYIFSHFTGNFAGSGRLAVDVSKFIIMIVVGVLLVWVGELVDLGKNYKEEQELTI